MTDTAVSDALKAGNMSENTHAGDEALLWLQRWEDEGGTWELLTRGHGSATVGLRRCDGGEEVDRFSSHGEQFLAYVDDRVVDQR